MSCKDCKKVTNDYLSLYYSNPTEFNERKLPYIACKKHTKQCALCKIELGVTAFNFCNNYKGFGCQKYYCCKDSSKLKKHLNFEKDDDGYGKSCYIKVCLNEGDMLRQYCGEFLEVEVNKWEGFIHQYEFKNLYCVHMLNQNSDLRKQFVHSKVEEIVKKGITESKDILNEYNNHLYLDLVSKYMINDLARICIGYIPIYFEIVNKKSINGKTKDVKRNDFVPDFLGTIN